MEKVINYLQYEKTKYNVVKLIADNLLYYQGIDTHDKIQNYSGLLYNQFVADCVDSNQYISLDDETIEKINEIYCKLVLNLRELSLSNHTISIIESIVTDHRKALITILKKYAQQTYSTKLYIPCSEYTSHFQKEILRISKIELYEPILDIGCGRKHKLITDLCTMGNKHVYGIDQYISSQSNILCSNWFDFILCKNTWGTVISHMSFTNHFRRALIYNTKDIGNFKQKYFEILDSLILNGTFIYTPSLRSIELVLDTSQYKMTYFSNTNDIELDTIHIQRII